MKEAYPVTDLNYVTDDIDQRNITSAHSLDHGIH
ncbi:hypothetical protein OROGR_009028 [Orobanche gracilis]